MSQNCQGLHDKSNQKQFERKKKRSPTISTMLNHVTTDTSYEFLFQDQLSGHFELVDRQAEPVWISDIQTLYTC